MKKILVILVLLSSTTVYSQTTCDSLLMNDLNIYRKAHGVKELIFDSLLYKRAAVKHLKEIDTLYHKKLYHSRYSDGEIIMYSNRLPFKEMAEAKRFNIFLKKYYNISFDDFSPSNNNRQRDKLITYVTKYIIFVYSESPRHNANMLSTRNIFVGCALTIKNIRYEHSFEYLTKKKYISAFLKNVSFSNTFEASYYFDLYNSINFSTYRFRK